MYDKCKLLQLCVCCETCGAQYLILMIGYELYCEQIACKIMQIEYEKIKFMIIHLVMEIIIHGYPIGCIRICIHNAHILTALVPYSNSRCVGF